MEGGIETAIGRDTTYIHTHTHMYTHTCVFEFEEWRVG
jgi:hypothetical protein